ncbi:tyrosine-type recombinase/integrase [Wenyingzhuangia sp. IMCC45533]
MANKLILSPTVHRNKEVVLIQFDYDDKIINAIKKIDVGAKWSFNKKSWYIDLQDGLLRKLYDHLSKIIPIDYSQLKNRKTLAERNLVVPNGDKVNLKHLLDSEQKEILNNFYKYLRGKRYSESTLKTYTNLIAEFIIYKDKEDVLDLRCIEKHTENILVTKKVSVSTHRQFISAMKHFLIFVGSDLTLDFTAVAPKKDKKLPNILSKDEVISLIRVTRNLKHRVCIALIYSSGLRISELLNLKIQDLDTSRMLLKVENSKGRKDRYVPIAQVMLPLIKNYIATYTPTYYLIEGLEKGQIYSPMSVRKFLKRSCYYAGIQKRVTPHTFRHSYATHLLENGTDIRYIQSLLGHSRPETTMLYTHVQSEDLQKITNPLDLIVKQIELRDKIN